MAATPSPPGPRAEPSGESVVLDDGTEIRVRPVQPGDKELIAAGFAAMGPEARRTRFLVAIDELDAPTLAYLTEIDHVDHEAIGAVGPAGEPLGVARYVRREDDPQTAEAAVAVVDAWQRRGVATVLLARLAERAEACGIEKFTATVLPDNDEVLALLDHFGVVRRLAGDKGLVEIDIDLADALSSDETFRDILRHAGTRLLGAWRPGRVDRAPRES